MISPEFERLLSTSFPKSLSTTMSERFQNELIEVKEVGTDINNDMQETIILTLSGHLFRMFIAIVFNKNDALKQIIQSALSKGSPELDNDAFYDYLNEVGNVLCGSIKRDIQKVIPSLGMSTPNLLKIESFKYIKELKIDHEGGYALTKDQAPLFYINYYLGSYGEIEFNQSSIIEEEEVDSGELEFF
jgi:CheY-specific phosphatase CheX